MMNEWLGQLMMLLFFPTFFLWLTIGIVEGTKFVAKEWFAPAKRSAPKPGAEALNTTKQ